MENNNGNNKRSEYLDQFERFCLSPRSDKEIEWVAGKLVEWAERDTSVTLLSFCADMAIAQTTLYEWEQRNAKLRSAMSLAKSMVGARRERLALENKYNAGIVNRTLGVYDDRVRAYDKEMKLVAAGDDKPQTLNVVMQNMPSVDSVPKRGKKKKNEDPVV